MVLKSINPYTEEVNYDLHFHLRNVKPILKITGIFLEWSSRLLKEDKVSSKAAEVLRKILIFMPRLLQKEMGKPIKQSREPKFNVPRSVINMLKML